MGNANPSLNTLVRQAQAINPVETAFRAVAGLRPDERAAFENRFNTFFGHFDPPLTITFCGDGPRMEGLL